jgi:hypothetical protein
MIVAATTVLDAVAAAGGKTAIFERIAIAVQTISTRMSTIAMKADRGWLRQFVPVTMVPRNRYIDAKACSVAAGDKGLHAA